MTQASAGISSFVRPSNMDELVGLDHIKQNLTYDIKGSKLLGQPIPSYVLGGPAGTGKSTVAAIIASVTGGTVLKILGNDLQKGEHVYDLAPLVKDNDVIYIEEAHCIGKSAQSVLLEWCENFQLLGVGGTVNAPKVCFVLPTTNPGRISKPLRERCRLLHTSYYKMDEIKEIIRRAALKFNIDVDSDSFALNLLAQSSRGTPRIAILQRLDALRKVMAVDSLPYSLSTVQLVLKINSINPWGLEFNDIKYCETLYQKLIENNGRPVSKKIIIQTTGFEEDILDNIIEAYLHQIGAIKIQSQGRVLTKFGFSLINQNDIQVYQDNGIDINKLKELLSCVNTRKLGMKAIAPKLGLKYGKDNAAIKAALHKCGFTAKQHIGMVSVT